MINKRVKRQAKRRFNGVANRRRFALSEDDLQSWLEDPEFTEEEARAFDAVGVGHDEAEKWMDLFSNDYEEVIPWIENGFSFDEAKRWYRMTDNEEGSDVIIPIINDLKNNGWTLDDLEGINSSFYFDISWALEWASAGFSVDDFWDWAPSDTPLQEAIEWRDSGLPGGGFAWFNEGMRGVDEAKAWNAAGFGLDEASAWRGYYDDPEYTPEEAKIFADAGIDVDEAKEWDAAGFGLSETIDWISKGLSIDEAKQAKDAGGAFSRGRHRRRQFIFGLGVSPLRKQIMQEIQEQMFLSAQRIDKLRDMAYGANIGGGISDGELQKIYALLNKNAREGKGIADQTLIPSFGPIYSRRRRRHRRRR